MINTIRKQYNAAFTQQKYHNFLDDIAATHNHRPSFRIAETPVFVPNDLKHRLIEASNEINEVICASNFKEMTNAAVEQVVPNETDHSLFLQMDFGIARDANGALTPQLIEVQGFPSLYFFQDLLATTYRKHFNIPQHYSHLFGDYNSEAYMGLLKDVIVGKEKPENVVL